MADKGFRIGQSFAEKIAATVRRVDATPYRVQQMQGPFRLEGDPVGGSGNSILWGVFEGAWLKVNNKRITLAGGQTVSAANGLVDIAGGSSCGSRKCCIGRDGNGWRLISAEVG